MAQFTLERKSESTGIAGHSDGYYLLYNGNYVMRQQADGNWVWFETQDANFNPDSFYVLDENNKSVQAKFLTYKGDYVLNSVDNSRGNLYGNLYIVPYDFNLENFIAKYKVLSQNLLTINPEDRNSYVNGVLLAGFRPGGVDDLQKSYGGTNGQPFVISFTSAASFVYGVASNIMGLTVSESIEAGGTINKIRSLFPGANNDTSGEAGNNPNNTTNIRSGYNFVNSLNNTYDLIPSNSSEAITTNTVSTTLGNEPILAAASPNSLVDFTSATLAQKWQYNFQTILGPSNPAFIDATLNSQDIDYNFRLGYNPNGVLWRVNAAGIPHPYDYQNFLEQNRVINTATNQTITEMQGSDDFPMTSDNLA